MHRLPTRVALSALALALVAPAPRRAPATRTTSSWAHLDSVIDGPGIQDDGSGSGALLEIAEQMERSTDAPAGSGAIANTFNGYFASRGRAFEPTPFDGRSDHGPFIAEWHYRPAGWCGAVQDRRAGRAVRGHTR